MQKLTEEIVEFKFLKRPLKELYYGGNKELLFKKKLSIVGTRRPLKYTQNFTRELAFALAKNGICVVSGGAMGVDALAHKGAKSENTISVLPCGIDLKYPAVNKALLEDIEKKGLLLSQFEPGFKAAPWSFVARNELVVALGDVLIVTEADKNSGSMRSVEFALKMGKSIYVLPHRAGESEGTNELLAKGLAKPIYDIKAFVELFAGTVENKLPEDEFLIFCSQNPSYEEALKKYPQRVFEAEFEGVVSVRNGNVYLL